MELHKYYAKKVALYAGSAAFIVSTLLGIGELTLQSMANSNGGELYIHKNIGPVELILSESLNPTHGSVAQGLSHVIRFDTNSVYASLGVGYFDHGPHGGGMKPTLQGSVFLR
jgi:hypothetical protein